nr:MAG: capsid protein [Totiviridae sp.]
MSSQLLDQLTGPLSNVLPNINYLAKTVKYGIKADVDIGVTSEYTNAYKRRGALFTNVLSPFGVLNAEVVRDPPNYDGINARFFNDYGEIDERAIAETLRLKGIYRVNVIADIAPAIAASLSENHVAVLVNMLRLIIIKRSDENEFKFKNDDLFYDDGHLAISYRNFLKRDFNEKLELTFRDDVLVDRFDENSIISDDFFCPNIENLSHKEYSIFMMMLNAIKCDYPLRLAFSSPRLVNKLTLPTVSKHGTYYDYVENFSAGELEQIMRKYIFANRLEASFDLAYLTVATAMYAPLPRAIEANGWVSPVNSIKLPAVGSIRGLLPEMTSGQPLSRNPQRNLTWMNYKLSPGRIAIHAIAVCEAIYTGFFEMLTANPGGIEETLAQVGVTSFVAATPYKMLCECAAFRFGKEFDLLWQTNAGVDIYSHLLATEPAALSITATVVDKNLEGYNVYTTSAEGVDTVHVLTKEVKPALFPVLSMGINDDRYFVNSLEYETTLFTDHSEGVLATTDSDQMNKAMSILRIGGYDAVMTDRLSGLSFRNWAANSNGQVLPMLPPGLKGKSTYVVPFNTLVKRRKHWIDLGELTDKVTLTAKISLKGYVILTNGKLVSTYMPKYNPITVYPKAMDKEEMVAVEMKTSSKAIKYRHSGFLLAANQEEAPPARSQLLSTDIPGSQHTEMLVQEDGAEEEI